MYSAVTNSEGNEYDEWTYDICTSIERDIERIVEPKLLGCYYLVLKHLNFGYLQLDAYQDGNQEEVGIDFIIGGDHASHNGGAFVQVGKLNLSSSAKRRKKIIEHAAAYSLMLKI